MTYSSLLFIYGFFPLSIAVYFVTPKKFKDIVLFLLSMIFCGFFSLKFLVFMIVYTAVNYTAARITYNLKWEESKYRKISSIPFATGIIFDVAAVLAFRTDIFSWIYKPFNLPADFFPVGISFFTLSAVGYLIDVYKGKLKAEINFIRFGLYIMMFSHLFMNPFQGYDNFVRMKRQKVRMNNLGDGMALFVKGLAKKVIVSDSLYMLYNCIKSFDIGELSCFTAWFGIIAYIFCLYFTLSGIADMGAGIACCFGFRYPTSFEYPLINISVRSFYTQWQIPVVHWLKKYAVNPFCKIINDKYVGIFVPIITLAFLGFIYTFRLNGILWGLFMGLAVVIEDKLRNIKMLKLTGIIYTFLVITILSVFLSCDSITESFHYLWAMIGGNRVFADSVSLYLLKSYVIILLVSMYASTDLFKNMIARIQKTRFRTVISVFSTIIILFIFAVCTAFISYTGSSDFDIIQL